MRFSFRSARSALFWLARPKSVKLHGVRVGSGPESPTDVRRQLYRGTYELAERLLLVRAVRPGDRVLEFGAGMGVVGLLAARLAGPGGAVLSVEANPRLEPVIRANQALNMSEIRPPSVIYAAVTSDGRDIDFHCNEDILSSSLFDRGKASSLTRVPGRKASELVADFGPSVLVMDVEGAEDELVPSIDYSGIRAVVVEVHERLLGNEKVCRLLRHLDAQGFELLEKLHSNYLFQRRVCIK